jgi:hypothetical protein
MSKMLVFLSLFICNLAYSKAFNQFEEIDTLGESQYSSNPMLMKTKPKLVARKIDRSSGFYNDLSTVNITELDESEVDMTSEEKEIDLDIKDISSSIKDELTSEKLSKVKDEIKLDNDSLEDVDTRYQKLLKINSTPKEPSDSEEIDISPY